MCVCVHSSSRVVVGQQAQNRRREGNVCAGNSRWCKLRVDERL